MLAWIARGLRGGRITMRWPHGEPDSELPALAEGERPRPAEGRRALGERAGALRRSIHVRHIDCGSDGSEEWEIQALWNPYDDIQRLGFFLAASPRHADVLLTGLTGGAVCLAHLEAPTERWQSLLSCTLLLFVAVAIEATNGFLLFGAWEALTVCVYLIASAAGDERGMRGGYSTGGLAKLGGGALLAAFAILYAHTHSFSFAVWAHASIGAGTRGLLFALLLACFATKVGVLPLHGGRSASSRSARWSCCSALSPPGRSMRSALGWKGCSASTRRAPRSASRWCSAPSSRNSPCSRRHGSRSCCPSTC